MSDEQDDAALEQGEPLAGALRADGARWRMERNSQATVIEQRLRASLLARADESDDLRVTSLGDGDGRDERVGRAMSSMVDHAPQVTAQQPRHDLIGARTARRPRAWVAVVATAVVFLGFIGSLFALHGGALLPGGLWKPTPWLSVPPPQYIIWQPGAADSVSPQQYFDTGARLTPCMHDPGATAHRGAPPKATAVTWLFSRPNYGIVNIQVTCSRQARPIWLWLQAFGSDAAGRWQEQGGRIYPNQNPFHSEADAVPAWLPLPSGAYDREEALAPYVATPGEPPTASLVVWLSQTRTYFLGHVSAGEQRPDGATTVLVNGRLGWAVQENGIVTVTTLLDDGTTLFFSGTGTPAEIEALAPIGFAHMSEALQPLLPPGDGRTPTP
ncbi:MAG TPA: hypothetical protein VF808_12505 [Ktedonobacterales bacterium]